LKKTHPALFFCAQENHKEQVCHNGHDAPDQKGESAGIDGARNNAPCNATKWQGGTFSQAVSCVDLAPIIQIILPDAFST